MSPSSRREVMAIADQGVASAGAFLTTVIFLRGAGMEEFGILSLVWLVLLFAASLQRAALVAPAHALIPKLSDPEATRFRGWLVLIQLALVLLLIGVLAACWVAPGFSLLPASPGLLAPCLFLTARLTFTFVRLQLFVSKDGPRLALPIDLIHVACSTGLLIGLAYSGSLDSRTGLLALAAASGLAALVALPRFLALGCSLGLPDRRLLSRHWRVSKWLLGKATAEWFTANSFLAALGTIHGPAALGGVRGAQTLIGLAGVVVQSFENVFPVRAAAAFGAGGAARLREFLQSAVWRWFGYLGACLLPIVLFPDFFLQLLTGDIQPDLREPLYFFAFGAFLALSVLCCQACLRATERVGPLFWAQLTAGAVGALAAVPITTRYGVTGCLVGILCQQVIVLLMLLRPAGSSLIVTPGVQH